MRLQWGDLDLTDYPFGIQFGSDFGAPQNVTETLAFLLQDGEIQFGDRASNRTIEFTVLVEGADLAEIADNEAALIAEAFKPLNQLVLDPEDFGPATVFRTFKAQVTHARNDDGELSRLRLFTVTMAASPYVQSAEETVTPALPASGSTTVNVDNGSSTTNWSGKIEGAPTAPSSSSGAVRLNSGLATGTLLLELDRTSTAIDTSSTKYLTVDWSVSGSPFPAECFLVADGVLLSKVAEAAAPTAGFLRSYFYVAASSVTALRFAVSTDAPVATYRGIAIDSVDRTDVAPGSTRQRLRTIDIGGSVRTPGTIAIQHESAALGDVFAYFWPDDGSGYSPPMRQYRSSGANTADTAAVTGIKDDIKAVPSVFDPPAGQVPRDTYTLYARVRASSSDNATVSWTLTTRMSGSDIGPSVTASRVVAMTTSYAIVALDVLELPTRDLEGVSPLSTVRLTMSATAAVATNVWLDEVWLVGHRGREVLVSVGTGTPTAGGSSNRVWLDAPSLTSPRPRILRGFAADRSDAFHARGIGAWRFPEMVPPRVSCMIVTTGADDAATSFRNFNQWHSHAAS